MNQAHPGPEIFAFAPGVPAGRACSPCQLGRLPWKRTLRPGTGAIRPSRLTRPSSACALGCAAPFCCRGRTDTRPRGESGNGLVDKRPAAILHCTTTDDVVEAVNVARESGLTV